jgi:hypothetical protein
VRRTKRPAFAAAWRWCKVSASEFADPVVQRIVAFVRSIGLPVVHGTLDDTAFLPGMALVDGGIVIDEARLRHPGDILHEAGHLAVRAPAERPQSQGRLGVDGGEEMGAIAWSYAATLHLGLNAAVLFHPEGYKDEAATLQQNFGDGHYLGVPYLQWLGLCYEPGRAQIEGCAPYPAMQRWLRE